MTHDSDLLARVADAIWMHSPLDVVQGHAIAPAILDALDLPARDRRVKAAALREAADAIELPTLAWDDGPSVEQENAESAAEAWLRARAAEIEPEEGDHEA